MSIGILFMMNLLWASSAFAQGAAAQSPPKPAKDNATYVLTKALKEPLSASNPNENKIDVAFGKSFPACTDDLINQKSSSPAVEKPDNWVIMIEAITGGAGLQAGSKTTLTPVSVITDFPCGSKLAVLTMAGKVDDSAGAQFDTKTHKVVVTYKQGNFPDVRFGRPNEEEERRRKTFTAAKGKDDADIYFYGSATGAHKSKPLYSIEAKIGYLWNFETKGTFGPRFTFNSDEGSDVDPDSITAKAAYQNIFVLGPSKYLFLNVNPIGGEFDKESNTRNLIAGADVKFVPRSVFLSERNIAAIDFTIGFDAGHNYKNVVLEDGSGAIWRLNVGASAHYVALAPWKFKRINFNADYLLRLPLRGEIFSEKIDGEDVFSITKRPRHNIGTDLEFMFSDAFGLTVKYQYGSLPPAFKLVDHKVSSGFTIKLRQNR